MHGPEFGYLAAQTGDESVVDQIQNALDTAHISGWQILGAALVLIAAWPVGKLVHRLVVRGFRKVPDVPAVLVDDVGRFARWFVYLLAFGLALSFLGVDVGWLALFVIVGLVLGGLMLRPIIENTAAGLVLTVRPAFTVGDQIEISGERGVVLEIGSHTTVLRTVDGVRIHIPNTHMLGELTRVYTAFDSRRAEFDITLDGSVDLKEALATILDALGGVDHVVADPAPDVVASAFSGDDMTVTVRVWYPSSMTSDRQAVDAAIRAVDQAIVDAGIALGQTDIKITRDVVAPPSGQPDTSAGSSDSD
jgi:small-conductance mechanosensitive channel